mgnify:CR=1 FL=1
MYKWQGVLNGGPGLSCRVLGELNRGPGVLNGVPGVPGGVPGVLNGVPGVLNGVAGDTACVDVGGSGVLVNTSDDGDETRCVECVVQGSYTITMRSTGDDVN